MNKTSQRGFTIIEVVITLFIFSIMLVLYVAASNTVTLNKTAKFQQIAYRIAEAELEGLRGTAFASLPVAGTSNISDPLLSQLPSGTATLTTVDANSKTKQFDVNVAWTDPGAKTHTVRLTTLITQGGLGQ